MELVETLETSEGSEENVPEWKLGLCQQKESGGLSTLNWSVSLAVEQKSISLHHIPPLPPKTNATLLFEPWAERRSGRRTLGFPSAAGVETWISVRGGDCCDDLVGFSLLDSL